MTRRATRPIARLYDALLALYPRVFRERYRSELVASFEDGLAEAEGPVARAAHLLRASAGALRHGIGERFGGRPGRGGWISDRPFRGSPRRRGPAGPSHLLAGVVRDLRLAVRSLARRPGFAAMVLGVSLLAVAAATLVFSVVDGTLLRAPAYGDPERIAVVWGRNAQNGQLRDVVSGPNYLDLCRGGRSFEHMAAFAPDGLVLMEDGNSTVVPTIAVTWEFFDVLGVEAALGRAFEPQDGVSGSEPVAVITDRAWRSRFGASPEAIGQRIATRDGFVTVVGVLPRDFEFVAQTDVFTPLYDDVLATYDRTYYYYWIVGLLREGATLDQANEELEGVMRQIRAEDPRLTGWSVAAEPLHEAVTEAVRPVLAALAVAVGVLGLVAAANVGGLFLVHATGLRSQVAIEMALGAGRLRVARRLAVEPFVVAAIGGGGGMLATIAGLRLLPAVVPPFVAIPGSAARVATFRADFDVRVAAFACGVALLVAIAGAVPAMLAGMARNTGGTVRSSDRSRTPSATVRRAHDVFVAAQIAFAAFLLVGGVAAFSTVRNLLAVDPGMRPGGVLTLYAGDLDAAGDVERAVYFRRLLDRLEEVEGVVGVGLNDYVPFQAEDDFEGISFLDRPPPPPGQGVREEWRRVSEGYFATAGIDVVAGRGLLRSDFGDAPTVAVVNEAFVRRHYPDGGVVGARILIHATAYGEAEIVGVVRDVRRRGLREEAPPVLYVPFDRHPRPNMGIFVRTAGRPEMSQAAVRAAISSVDPSQPIDRVAAMDRLVADSMSVPRLAMLVLSGLSLASLVLAGMGIFGVLAYAVRARAAEFGVRIALGATGARLQRPVVLRGVVLWLVGVAAGTGLALVAARAAESLLFGVAATDAAVIGPGAVALLVVTAAASWLPARRIARIDPSLALRGD